MGWRIQSTVQASKGTDVTYDLYFTALQSHLEIWLGITAATLPTLAPISSKYISPAISKYLTPRLRHSGPNSGRRHGIQTIGGGGDIPLRRTEFSRLEEGLLGHGEPQHSGKAEAVPGDSIPTPEDESGWSGHRDVIKVRQDVDIVAEPYQRR